MEIRLDDVAVLSSLKICYYLSGEFEEGTRVGWFGLVFVCLFLKLFLMVLKYMARIQ